MTVVLGILIDVGRMESWEGALVRRVKDGARRISRPQNYIPRRSRSMVGPRLVGEARPSEDPRKSCGSVMVHNTVM